MDLNYFKDSCYILFYIDGIRHRLVFCISKQRAAVCYYITPPSSHSPLASVLPAQSQSIAMNVMQSATIKIRLLCTVQVDNTSPVKCLLKRNCCIIFVNTIQAQPIQTIMHFNMLNRKEHGTIILINYRPTYKRWRTCTRVSLRKISYMRFLDHFVLLYRLQVFKIDIT